MEFGLATNDSPNWRCMKSFCRLRRMFVYALPIFTGAFLLFQVQPLIGKYILPWFGGAPGVWTTCMLFFQVLLLAGYAYAHFLSRWFKPRGQVIVHLGLLLMGLAVSQVTPDDSWKPRGTEHPTLDILVLLTACLGLPYFLLASTGPLMQQWFSRTNPGVSPYRLYALSNVGSLLALVSYPFFIETRFTRQMQADLWTWGFGAYVLFCVCCAWWLWRKNPADTAASIEAAPATRLNLPRRDSHPSLFDQLLWLLLPACASVLLLATTNKMCQDVAVIPFLWVLPLALYLLTFIISFDSPRWYRRGPFALALVGALGATCWALFQGTDAPLKLELGIYAFMLFTGSMVCHGELYRLKPNPRHLTTFYLLIAAGGALGGLFVALIAPLIFTDYHELHWGLFACGLLFTVVCARERSSEYGRCWRWLACILTLLGFAGLDQSLAWMGARWSGFPDSLIVTLRVGLWSLLAVWVTFWIGQKRFATFRGWQAMVCAWLAVGLLALALALRLEARESDESLLTKSRGFYGTLAVHEYRRDDPQGHYYLLQHGRITHGLQFVDPELAAWPTSYYGPGSGISLAVNALPEGGRRIGVVGLGTGTMAIFGRTNDYLRMYEINPQVEQVARSTFRYLRNSPAQVEIVMGDARLSLEREPPQKFDLLALDAFTSDAIPVHLLTKEAFALYERHVSPHGIIAVHISNRYLNLEPVVANVARHFNYHLAVISWEEGNSDSEAWDAEWVDEWWLYSSTWVLLTRNEEIINAAAIREAASPVKTNAVNIPLWTDDFASLFQILQ